VSRSTPPPVARIGITVGDPAGIGPEVVSKALRAGGYGEARLFVYGDLDAVDRAGGIPADVKRLQIATARVEPGAPDPAAASGVVEAIRKAARDCLDGTLDAMATGPIAKEMLAHAGFPYPGHTELLEETCGSGTAVMLLTGGRLRVALATVHCPLREVPERLTRPRIESVLRVLAHDLRMRFGIREPRIAVCGLNPHAGEGGRFGDEEERVIRPAVDQVRGDGIDARGPFAADSLFARAVRGEFDAVVGMYHDQALAPLKVHAFGRAVNVTLGLRLIRTSVDHGTAFDIAGRGVADEGSMVEAIRLAREIAERVSGGTR
jgi:4-hydroxythreonine-4-phosphate dehydrogenase